MKKNSKLSRRDSKKGSFILVSKRDRPRNYGGKIVIKAKISKQARKARRRVLPL